MRRSIICLALLALSSLPCLGQSTSSGQPPQTMEFKDLLYGNSTPLTLKLKDLNSDWRRLSVGGASDAGGMGFLGSLFGGGKGAVYYTKGQAVNIAGETYIVAYKADLKQVNLMSLIMESASNGGKEPDMSKLMPEKLTPDTTLSLSLLNLKTSGNLSDIRPFDMAQEIADSGNSDNGLMDLMMLGMMSEKDKNKASTSVNPKPIKKPASKP